MGLVISQTLALPIADPFSRVHAVPVVPGGAVVFHMNIPRIDEISQKIQKKDAPIVVKLDGWPGRQIGSKIFIRIGAQGIGCTLDCRTCEAGPLPGYNLSAWEMAYQVVHVLASQYIKLQNIHELVISFMGTGETLANPAIIEAIKELHILFPTARFIVSFTGFRKGGQVFRSLIDLVLAGIDIDLQISLNHLDQDWRMGYVGDSLGEGGSPKKTLTVVELSEYGNVWFKETRRKVHVNLVLGPDFKTWLLSDYGFLTQLFHTGRCWIKLSPEGKIDNTEINVQIAMMSEELQKRGYSTYVYDPVGNREGAGCASLDLVSIAKT
jgi:adenine C2-methylase RlmN of 23S rRNA A2503 and tRNA A37